MHEKDTQKCVFWIDECSVLKTTQQATWCARELETKAIFGNYWKRKDADCVCRS